ncbi:MAG: leucine-rich repeat protein, partial [Dysgonamonadaceae bacterium]|nr:leucine-rich repeat protein [Dysgonamonadaceae bacterium]
MKYRFFTFKSLVMVALFWGANLALSAQVEKTIHLSISGTLATLLTADEKASVTKLTVTTGAALDDADFAALNALPALKELDLSGDDLTTAIPANAFQNNATIETFKFPAKTNTLNAGIFNNSALKGVVSFPSTITNMAMFVSRFDNCQGITGFNFINETKGQGLWGEDGVILTNQGWGICLMKYPCGKTDETYTIPEGVTYIAQQAFGDNHRLKKLVLSSTVNQFQNITAIYRNSTALAELDAHPNNPLFGSLGGLLYRKDTKEFYLRPPAYKSPEELVVDGSQIEIIPSNIFTNDLGLKSVIFTEGFREVGYTAFKAAENIEYIEMPSTMDTIAKEAFHGCAALRQLICKATVPPRIDEVVFRSANGTNVRVGVPASAVEDYRASRWNSVLYPAAQAFPPAQIVPYYEIAYVGAAEGLRNASVAGYQVKITAGEAPDAQSAFSGWESVPAGVQFTNRTATTTYFTMPDYDVTISAVFTALRSYTVTGATGVASGQAAVGSIVNLETAAYKTEGGLTLYFRNWRVVTSNGLTIGNPAAVSTSFVMIDGAVEIEAVYEAIYMLSISGGSASELEYFAGDVVTITAATRPGKTFSEWTTTTPGVVFANPAAAVTTFVMPAGEVEITAV